MAGTAILLTLAQNIEPLRHRTSLLLYKRGKMFGFEKLFQVATTLVSHTFLQIPSNRQGYLVGEQDDHDISGFLKLLPGL